ncbi:MAG: hypothetical protein JSR18_03200 [Proteobacteria bacterium]|nr:hypothetical protein [Pseudomonadota bacterium]
MNLERDSDVLTQAMASRRQVPAHALWAMLKCNFYLATGFAGAMVAAIALRALLAHDASLTGAQALAALVAGVAITVFAWMRAPHALDALVAEADATAPVAERGHGNVLVGQVSPSRG